MAQVTTKATKVLQAKADHLGQTPKALHDAVQQARDERLQAETREAYLAIKQGQRGVV